MNRTIMVCLITTVICTLGSAAIFAVPHWNDPEPQDGSCFFPPMAPALNGGLIFGLFGFMASWVLGPAAAITDRSVRKHRMKFDYRQMQAQNDAQSLLRGASVPMSLQKAELLRAAQTGSTTPPRELLRSVPPEETTS
ncbi:MAG: hypothetical protein JWN14_5162 [Chthonomonadales bacterium]|nr:hypothetical protein [Chthonomonadales bacterium]